MQGDAHFQRIKSLRHSAPKEPPPRPLSFTINPSTTLSAFYETMGAAISIAVGVGVYTAVKHQKKKRRGKKARRAAVALAMHTGNAPPYEAKDSSRKRDSKRRRKGLFGRERRLGKKLKGHKAGGQGFGATDAIRSHPYGSDTTLVHGSPPPYSTSKP